jgi:hypothetical protein
MGIIFNKFYFKVVKRASQNIYCKNCLRTNGTENAILVERKQTLTSERPKYGLELFYTLTIILRKLLELSSYLYILYTEI